MIGSQTDIATAVESEKEKQLREFAREQIKKVFHTPLSQIKKEMAERNKSFETIIKEVDEKKSNLPHDAREFVKNFKTEIIEDWLEDVK